MMGSQRVRLVRERLQGTNGGTLGNDAHPNIEFCGVLYDIVVPVLETRSQ